MELYESAGRGTLENWAIHFPPAGVTLCRLETGEEIQETSLVAAKAKPAEEDAFHASLKVEQYLAAGKAARSCGNTPDVTVFSPLRRGQVASYDGTVYLFRDFLRRLCPGLRLPKPVLCIRMQEQTTEVERIALIDAGIQAGARKVILYRGSLSALREAAAGRRDLRRALVFHIET